jgi:archaeosortase A (PGF-CTERM-specific)
MLNKPVVSLPLMILSWLIADVLWIALLLLLVSALTGRRFLAGFGWLFFGIHWLKQPAHYLAIGDYFNVGVTIIAFLFSIYMVWIILARGCRSKACAWASCAVAIGGFVYFPFAEFVMLKTWLIGHTTLLTALLLESFGIPILITSWNVMMLNNHSVEIILACTAIESIALFIGVILSVRAPIRRKFWALMVSVPVIYSLNLVRNAFVLVAYGQQWFGEGSFFIAHNVIAKIGSTLVLFLIAYLVLLLLPELLDLIDELAWDIKHQGRDAV